MFNLGKHKTSKLSYDASKKVPVVRCSICTGEQVAGFKDVETGKFEDVMLITSPADLEAFKAQYGITGEVDKTF